MSFYKGDEDVLEWYKKGQEMNHTSFRAEARA